MFRLRLTSRLAALAFTVAVGTSGVGCQSLPSHGTPPPEPIPDLQLPKELNKVTLPTYTIEAPDILVIESTRTIPLPPYKIQPLDALFVVMPEDQGLPGEPPIKGIYPVEPDGTINLGPGYGGTIQVADLTTAEAQKKITTFLRRLTREATPSVSLAASGRGAQQIAGQHLVRQDGTVGLGVYGSVYVAGMTLQQAKQAIEQHLTRFLYRPEVSIDVFSFNSKWYYVITDFAGNGEQVQRLPCTGNETVLDAIAQIGGLSSVSSKKLWVARPAPAGTEDQILPVDWKGITRRGKTSTNYQVLPGDRVFVMSQPLTKFDTYLGRALAPAERAFGFTLLGSTAVREASGRALGVGNGN